MLLDSRLESRLVFCQVDSLALNLQLAIVSIFGLLRLNRVQPRPGPIPKHGQSCPGGVNKDVYLCPARNRCSLCSALLLLVEPRGPGADPCSEWCGRSAGE